MRRAIAVRMLMSRTPCRRYRVVPLRNEKPTAHADSSLALAASVALFWGAVDIVGVPATRLAGQLVWVTLGVVMLVATARARGLVALKTTPFGSTLGGWLTSYCCRIWGSG